MKGFMTDHALGQETRERLLDAAVAALEKRPSEKTGIKKMQNRMFDATDILVHRHPVIHGPGIEGGLRMRRTETGEIPGGFKKGVEGVGFPLRRLAALRAVHVFPAGVALQRVSGLVERNVLGQRHRKVRFGHRDHTALVAMNDGNGTAPIALAGNPPIAKPVQRDGLALAGFGETRDGRSDGVVFLQPIEEAGVDQDAVAGGGRILDGKRLAVWRHHRGYRQGVFAGEFQIALVVGGAAENSAAAILHQYEIGHVEGQSFALDERMHDFYSGIVTFLFGRLDDRFAGPHSLTLFNEFR